MTRTDDDLVVTIPAPIKTMAVAAMWFAAVALAISGSADSAHSRSLFFWAVLVAIGAGVLTIIGWMDCHLRKVIQDAYTLGECARELSLVPNQRQH